MKKKVVISDDEYHCNGLLTDIVNSLKGRRGKDLLFHYIRAMNDSKDKYFANKESVRVPLMAMKQFMHRPTDSPYDALGICTFGPVGVNPLKPETYGKILPGSPKKEWRNVDILTPILDACSCGEMKPKYKVDTDVNAPAMAEFEYRTKVMNENISSLAYVTVGTGIGVGLVINSLPVHGMMHPEGGHVAIVPLNSDDKFEGYSWGAKSPYKGKNTVEGTASSVALTERLGSTNSSEERDALKDLGDDHPIWDHAANSLANLCCTLVLITSVEKIIFGGGVMNRSIIYKRMRSRTKELLNGYIDLDQVTTEDGLNNYISPSVWNESEGYGAGLVGALTLAQLALS